MHEKWSDTLAVILAGGLGTRLRSMVADRPKVLAPVLGRPFVSHLLDQLAGAGIQRVVILTGYRGQQVVRELGTSHGGMELLYAHESQPLGTGGAVRAAWPHLTRPNLLLLNGDSYCDVDLAAFADFHRRQQADLSMVITPVPDCRRYGQVVLASEGTVSDFREKQTLLQRGWINAGVYVLRRGLVPEIPPGRPVSLERELLPAWLTPGCGKRISGFRCPGPFLDIGTPESYSAAETFFRKRRDEVHGETVSARDCVPAP